VNLADVRRERIGLPVLRDERPELLVRELERLVAARADLRADERSTTEAKAASTNGSTVRSRRATERA
jgi:hypothetical protein